MANFKGTIITTKGHALIAKAVANTATINFTRAATSSHDYTSSTNSDLESLINLSDIKQYSTIDKVEAVNTSYKVFTKFTNKDLTDGYYVRAIGLFATDPQDGEILYSVTVAENADWFPADNGVNCSGINLDLNTGISNTSNVTLNVNYSAYATLDDIEKVNASLSESVNRLKDISINVRGIGYLAPADGTSHPISTYFPKVTLEEVQALNSNATLEWEADWYAIQKAQKDALANDYSIFIPNAHYMCNNLVFSSVSNVESNGAILDFTPVISGICCNITNANGDVHPLRKSPAHKLSGIVFIGNNVKNVIGLNFNTVTVYCINNCSTWNFDKHINYENNTWAITFNDCSIGNEEGSTGAYGTGITFSGTINRGEKINFKNCSFYGLDLILDINGDNIDCFFDMCAWDYCNKQVKLIGASSIYFTNGHIESNYDPQDYSWFHIENPLKYGGLTIDNSNILPSAALTKCMFNVVNYGTSYLFVTNIKLSSPWNLATGKLVTGGSPHVKVSNLSCDNNIFPIISSDQNFLSNTDFELGEAVWTKNGSWYNNISYIDSTMSRSGSKCAVFRASSGGSCALTQTLTNLNFTEAKMLSILFYMKNDGTANETWGLFKIDVVITERNDIQTHVSTFTVNTSLPNWTMKLANFIIPADTKQIDITLTQNSDGSSITWVDDILVGLV